MPGAGGGSIREAGEEIEYRVIEQSRSLQRREMTDAWKQDKLGAGYAAREIVGMIRAPMRNSSAYRILGTPPPCAICARIRPHQQGSSSSHEPIARSSRMSIKTVDGYYKTYSLDLSI